MIEESKTRGWAAVVFGVIGMTGLLLIVTFFLMLVEDGDARSAASRVLNVMVVGGVGVGLILMLIFGMLLVHRSDRDMVNGIAPAIGAAVASALAKRGEQDWGEKRDYYISTARPKPTKTQRNVRALLVSGERMPYGMDDDDDLGDGDEVELTTRLDDKELSVPASLLRRFSLMPHPTRAMFGGKATTYGKICDWFIAQGVLERTANNGVRWNKRWDAGKRARWLSSLASPTDDDG